MLLALLCGLFAWGAPRAAQAWTEARPSGIATEVTIDHDGGATVSLRVRWTVLGGRMHQFDLAELPGDMTLIEASAVAGNGAPVPVSTRATGTGRLEVNLGDESRGVRRGTIDVVLRYTTSLRAHGAIERAGGDAVVQVVTAPWARGVDSVEVRVAVPTSSRRAQWMPDETLGVEADTTTELSRDVVHALRRHLPANERWTARIAVDPSVFPWLGAGVARRPVVMRRAPPPYAHTAVFAVVTLLVSFALARAFARLGPVSRASRLAPVLCVAGVALQSLYVLRVPSTLAFGTLLIGAAAASRAPVARPLATVTRGVSRMRGERELLAPPSRWPRAVALSLALVATVATLVAAAQGQNLAAVIAVDLALALMAWAAFAARAEPALDLAVLRPLSRRVHESIRSSGRARVAWRVRGDERTRGALRLRVVALPGWRYARGVRAIECAVREETCDGALTVRVELGSAVERPLRMLAARAGELMVSPDESSLSWTVALVGPDADVAFAGLRDLTDALFTRAPERGALESDPAPEAVSMSSAR